MTSTLIHMIFTTAIIVSILWFNWLLWRKVSSHTQAILALSKALKLISQKRLNGNGPHGPHAHH